MFSLLLHNSVCINVLTCTATDRYCSSITNRNYIERKAQREEKTIRWQEWKFHMAMVSKAFDRYSAVLLYICNVYEYTNLLSTIGHTSVN